MRFSVVSLFPEMFESFLELGVIGQAHKTEKFHVQFVNPRSFATDRYKTVDDKPFGGGDSMVLMAPPLEKAMESIGIAPKRSGHREKSVIYLTPQGRVWNDALARDYSEKQELVLICGRYGGIDERFINQYVDEEISIGDFVLSGGEIAAMVLMDSIMRLLPGTLGNKESAHKESFADGLLEAPLFTRPQTHMGIKVPDVLISGNHREIEGWRKNVAILRTALRRPDLIRKSNFPPEDLHSAKTFFDNLTASEREILGLPSNRFEMLESF